MFRVAVLAATTLAVSACTREYRLGPPDGEARVLGRRDVSSRAEVGPWIWTYPNGVPRERGTYADGARVGKWTQWWSNGELRSEGERVHDPASGTSPRHGPWVFWHPNGAVAARGVYRLGRREGEWEYSLDDGDLDGDQSGIYHDDARLADR